MAAQPPVRVHCFGVQRLVLEMLETAVRADPGVEFVGYSDTGSNLFRDVEESEADFVVFSLDDGQLPEACRTLLDLRARVKLLAISKHDGQSFVYRLIPDVHRVGHERHMRESATADEIVAEMRRVAAEPLTITKRDA